MATPEKSDIFFALKQGIASAAERQTDYPNISEVSLARELERAKSNHATICIQITELEAAISETLAAVETLKRKLISHALHDSESEVYEAVSKLASLQESHEGISRKIRRLNFRLRVLKTETLLLPKKNLPGRSTLASQVANTVSRCERLLTSIEDSRTGLSQLSGLGAWSRKISEAANQISAGFSDIGARAVFDIAYGVEAPKIVRRSALSVLLRWTKSLGRVQLTELLTNHWEFTKAPQQFESIEELNFIEYHNSRKVAGSVRAGEEYLLMLELLALERKSWNVDNQIWLANFVSKMERLIFEGKVTGNAQIAWLNQSLASVELSPLNIKPGSADTLFDRVSSSAEALGFGVNQPLVSLLVPVYNGEKWISTAITSMLNQSWKALEIFIVDDCSTDSTYSIAKSFEAIDPRVRVLRSKNNRGPYHCRNLALAKASGKYVTVHDADDWSHPQKIEIQVTHLENNEAVVANVSQGARVDEYTLQAGIAGRTSILRPNFSSLMFRREPVLESLGFWDEVRFGGDSEFQNRLVAHFGEASLEILNTGMLSLLRILKTSLTAGGIQEQLSGARKLYKKSFSRWHAYVLETGGSFKLDPSLPRRFYAPMQSLGVDNGLSEYDLILVADFSKGMEDSSEILELINLALARRMNVAISHVPTLETIGSEASLEIETWCLAKSVDMLWHRAREATEAVTFEARELMVLADVLQAKFDRVLSIRAAVNTVLTDRDYVEEFEFRQRISDTFLAMFEAEPALIEIDDAAIASLGQPPTRSSYSNPSQEF